ncbi:hypothetical protein PtA15_6A712 [Puccinia triticina]|uniref:Uncharacterized protein n=1 Tax=Puccinia triticina TaxID=208348 RepID=A0ABY7CTP1_9BASI|nr:uncharacterized protein PtA15_6A712 [Puccinia triticina]WAQ86082.1 hypothetical protein PtA15_6A712 [Puccinia triticina]
MCRPTSSSSQKHQLLALGKWSRLLAEALRPVNGLESRHLRIAEIGRRFEEELLFVGPRFVLVIVTSAPKPISKKYTANTNPNKAPEPLIIKFQI